MIRFDRDQTQSNTSEDRNKVMGQLYKAVLNRENFTYKFTDSPISAPPETPPSPDNQVSVTGDVLHPGWAEPTFGSFSKRIVDKPVLMGLSEFIKMTSVQHDLDMLDSVVELHSQRGKMDYEENRAIEYDRLGTSLHLVNEEVPMNTKRKQLVAVPFQAKSVVYDNYLDENIEKQSFFSDWCNYLANLCGPAYQRQALYSIRGSLPPRNQGTGLTMNDGILQQLTQIYQENKGEWGFAPLVPKSSIVLGIQQAVQQFIDNNANVNGAKIVLPPHIYSRMTTEIANDRISNLGDIVLQNGKMYTIQGFEIVLDPVLRDTRNGWNRRRFDQDGRLCVGDPLDDRGNNSEEKNYHKERVHDKIVYGFITTPGNLIFGVMHDISLKTQWDIDILGYKVALTLKGDYKVHWDQDTMAIPFTLSDNVLESIFPDNTLAGKRDLPVLVSFDEKYDGANTTNNIYTTFMNNYRAKLRDELGLIYDELDQAKKIAVDQGNFTRSQEKRMGEELKAYVKIQRELSEVFGTSNWGNVTADELQPFCGTGKLFESFKNGDLKIKK